MATINGVTFNLKNLRIVSGHRNVMTEQPGSDSNFINDMGYDGLTLRLEGYETSLSDYDAVISEFMKQGEQILIHRTGWQFSVYSAQLTPGLLEGFDDTYFPYNLILYTSTPYRESTTSTCITKKITSNNQEWSAEDMPCNAYVKNPSFEHWPGTSATAPDGWEHVLNSGTIARESSTVKTLTYSVKLTSPAGDNANIRQSIPVDDLPDETITVGAWVYATDASKAKIFTCVDGANCTSSSYHTGGGTWEFLTVTRTGITSGSYFNIYCRVESGSISAYFDSVCFIAGSDDPSSTFTDEILTGGSVDAVPDIQVSGGVSATSAVATQTASDSNYNLSASEADVTITQPDETSSASVNSGQSLGQTVNCRKAGMAIIDSFEIDVSAVSTSGDVVCTCYDSVGGTSLGSKTDNISGTGAHVFTFATPIAVVQAEETCADSTDANKIYFKITAAVADITIDYDNGGGYGDGQMYNNDSPSSDDLKFEVIGHSCKEVQQTFQVSAACKVTSVVLNMCLYQYAGSNPVTVILKESSTTLGTATTVLSGSTFTTFTFTFAQESAGSLNLSTGTTYTLHITPPSDSVNATDVLLKTNTTSVYASGAVTLIEDGATERAQTHDIYFVVYGGFFTNTPQVYNTADSTVICDVANVILAGAVHRINADGTGTVWFEDGFYTTKYLTTSTALTGCTHDSTNKELDIADDGYIYWLIDTKYPITGIPTLTAQINNTAATLPTIQISTDASTWYDIDTVVVDDTLTEYPLDDDGNLSLKGRTSFYFRIDCAAAAVTQGCSVKSFVLEIDIVTIDAEHPKITAGSTASTFTCDQASTSNMSCDIALIYRDRSWAV